MDKEIRKSTLSPSLESRQVGPRETSPKTTFTTGELPTKKGTLSVDSQPSAEKLTPPSKPKKTAAAQPLEARTPEQKKNISKCKQSINQATKQLDKLEQSFAKQQTAISNFFTANRVDAKNQEKIQSIQSTLQRATKHLQTLNSTQKELLKELSHNLDKLSDEQLEECSEYLDSISHILSDLQEGNANKADLKKLKTALDTQLKNMTTNKSLSPKIGQLSKELETVLNEIETMKTDIKSEHQSFAKKLHYSIGRITESLKNIKLSLAGIGIAAAAITVVTLLSGIFLPLFFATIITAVVAVVIFSILLLSSTAEYKAAKKDFSTEIGSLKGAPTQDLETIELNLKTVLTLLEYKEKEFPESPIDWGSIQEQRVHVERIDRQGW